MCGSVNSYAPLPRVKDERDFGGTRHGGGAYSGPWSSATTMHQGFPLLAPRSDILEPHPHPVDRSVGGRCGIHGNQFDHDATFILEIGGQTCAGNRRSRA